VSHPETGNTPTQIAQGSQDLVTITEICNSLGVVATPSPTAAPSPSPTAALSPAVIGTSFPNDKATYDYLITQGLTSYEAAGIVGNFDWESNDKPTKCEVTGCASGGRGIGQWTVGTRWTSDTNNNVVWYASRLPGSPAPTTLDPQQQFTWYELTTFPTYGLATLRASGTVTNATIAFQDKFEACTPLQCNTATREQYAREVLAEYGGTSPQNYGPVKVAAMPSGQGYWELTGSGAIYSYGDANYYGGANGQEYFAGESAVSMAVSANGTGYWILSDTGGIYSYGSAPFEGSAGGQTYFAGQTPVALVADSSGTGYWILAASGAIYSYNAPFEGSPAGQTYFAGQSAVSMAPSANGTGYWVMSDTGSIYSFGGATYEGGGT